MTEEHKRQRTEVIVTTASSSSDPLGIDGAARSTPKADEKPHGGSKKSAGLCSMCQCVESSRFYRIDLGSRVLIALAAGHFPRGLNFAGMAACTACYKALTSSESSKWSSGSAKSTVIFDCERLVLKSPALTGTALVQLGAGEGLRIACRRLRDEHAQHGMGALDPKLMAFNRSDRSDSWCLMPGAPGANVSISNRLRFDN